MELGGTAGSIIIIMFWRLRTFPKLAYRRTFPKLAYRNNRMFSRVAVPLFSWRIARLTLLQADLALLHMLCTWSDLLLFIGVFQFHHGNSGIGTSLSLGLLSIAIVVFLLLSHFNIIPFSRDT